LWGHVRINNRLYPNGGFSVAAMRQAASFSPHRCPIWAALKGNAKRGTTSPRPQMLQSPQRRVNMLRRFEECCANSSKRAQDYLVVGVRILPVLEMEAGHDASRPHLQTRRTRPQKLPRIGGKTPAGEIEHLWVCFTDALDGAVTRCLGHFWVPGGFTSGPPG
jgi:hypothetical protein